jgi:Toprim domain-containing protein
MMSDAALLAAHLAENAEAVCKEYLSQGRRSGNYWLVGDVHDNPGRSLFVRLEGPTSGRGAAGKWTDAATGEHGDLLDLISHNRGHTNLRDTLEEARGFLNEPSRLVTRAPRSVPRNRGDAARRLFAASRPLCGTLAETYLKSRGITAPLRFAALRFHPNCYYRADNDSAVETWPALIAAVTDPSGAITGVLRTWLARDGSAKAPFVNPRRAMGDLLGHAIRFGVAQDVLAAGEGIETMLSLKSLLPRLPMAAALSASHLGALLLPPTLQRLYVAVDNDAAGRRAAGRLMASARRTNMEARLLVPRADDWNTDLDEFGPRRVLTRVAAQLTPEDAVRFAPRLSL